MNAAFLFIHLFVYLFISLLSLLILTGFPAFPTLINFVYRLTSSLKLTGIKNFYFITLSNCSYIIFSPLPNELYSILHYFSILFTYSEQFLISCYFWRKKTTFASRDAFLSNNRFDQRSRAASRSRNRVSIRRFLQFCLTLRFSRSDPRRSWRMGGSRGILKSKFYKIREVDPVVCLSLSHPYIIPISMLNNSPSLLDVINSRVSLSHPLVFPIPDLQYKI